MSGCRLCRTQEHAARLVPPLKKVPTTREPIYKTRPVEPSPTRFGSERINDFTVISEGFSNNYLIETAETNVQFNAGMDLEAPVHAKNYEAFNPNSVRSLILTQGHVGHLGGVAYFRERNPRLRVFASSDNPKRQA